MDMSRFAGQDGAQLAYREIGSGRRLILLHGFLGTGSYWLDQGPADKLVEQGFRLVLPDLRGHGESTRSPDPRLYPPDVLADDGLALIEHLGLGAGEYDLGGYSLGGRIVVRLLARGAEPGRAIVAGQGLAEKAGPHGGGRGARPRHRGRAGAREDRRPAGRRREPPRAHRARRRDRPASRLSRSPDSAPGREARRRPPGAAVPDGLARSHARGRPAPDHDPDARRDRRPGRALGRRRTGRAAARRALRPRARRPWGRVRRA